MRYITQRREIFRQMRPDLQGKTATIRDRSTGMTQKCRDVEYSISENPFHNMFEELYVAPPPS